MNQKLVFALLTTLLTACGGGSSSGNNTNTNTNTVIAKPIPYTSASCMQPKAMKEAGINLSGVTLRNACINEASTPGALVLEGAAGKQLEFLLDEQTNLLAVATGAILLYEEDSIKFRKEISNDSGLSNAEQVQLFALLDDGNAAGILQNFSSYLKKRRMKFFLPAHIKGGTARYEMDRLDYSIRVTFANTGTYDGLERMIFDRMTYGFFFIRQGFPEGIEQVSDSTVVKTATRDAIHFQPRKETYRFVIKPAP